MGGTCPVTESCIRPSGSDDLGVYSTNAGTARFGNTANCIEVRSAPEHPGVTLGATCKGGAEVGLTVQSIVTLKGMSDNPIQVQSALQCDAHTVSAADFVLSGTGKSVSQELLLCNSKLSEVTDTLAASLEANAALQAATAFLEADLLTCKTQLTMLLEQVQNNLPGMEVFVDSMNNLIRVSNIEDDDEDA
jgi:hypothetical protein